MLTVIDEHTREALSVTVTNTTGSPAFFETLFPLLLKRGKPEYLQPDNGTGFSSAPFKEWLTKVGMKQIRIYPGSPWVETVCKSLQWSDWRSNRYNERFNGTRYREVLTAKWFGTTRKAQTVINQSLQQDNQIQPQQAMRMRPPTTETILEKHQITGP